jgi:hypothetical protein
MANPDEQQPTASDESTALVQAMMAAGAGGAIVNVSSQARAVGGNVVFMHPCIITSLHVVIL